MSRVAFIALHGGAGIHNPANHEQLRALLQDGCTRALQHAQSVEDAVRLAIELIESSPLTNAGYGSCLTEDGRVECEAGVMTGNGCFASVGAMTGVEHPINVAYELYRDRVDRGLIKELGRFRPIMLMGEGAYRFAQSKGLSTVPRDQFDRHHITTETYSKWQRFREAIRQYMDSTRKVRIAANERSRVQHESQGLMQGGKKRKLSAEHERNHRTNGRPSQQAEGEADGENHRYPDTDVRATTDSNESNNSNSSDSIMDLTDTLLDRPDTVGAIACDYDGHVAAAVSSGGIWMKMPGRIGSSAVIGSGCFCEDDDGTWCGTAASISGGGEDIMEKLMALKCCEIMKSVQFSDEKSEESRDSEPPAIGAFALKVDQSITPHTPPTLHDSLRTVLLRRKRLSANKNRQHNADTGNEMSTETSEPAMLSTGLIVLRTKQLDDGAMKVTFCFSHTSPHFAVGMAAASEPTAKAWISQRQVNTHRDLERVEIVSYEQAFHFDSSGTDSGGDGDGEDGNGGARRAKVAASSPLTVSDKETLNNGYDTDKKHRQRSSSDTLTGTSSTSTSPSLPSPDSVETTSPSSAASHSPSQS